MTLMRHGSSYTIIPLYYFMERNLALTGVTLANVEKATSKS